ncbi:hypothetical protein QB781_003899 [Salmonella enterica]|nr:hypothetical protein [Salmonella enterica]EIP6687057.1 hypothetical protein [Salmonella enterica subsp. enterica serovar Javiana]EIP6743312.1 hypothetical protein [Salmonella enterica subsp. enterica serovar Javiana]EIQ4670008.1 hypothetical protein [Salmonella enterica subsp. enterica serovar Javiana]EIR2402402.1 hypothetical protein [Salmonella enterica subsp. enterica serovar Javiana]
MINMKNTSIYGFWLLCSCAALPAGAADIEIRFSNPQPTCNVSVVSPLDLGTLAIGEKKHTAFPVSIACSGTIKNALTAKNLNGTLQANQTEVSVQMQNTGGGNGPFLELEDSIGQKIRLTGQTIDSFCTVTSGGNRNCMLTPVTKTKADSGWGNGSVTLRFEIVYPT